MGDESNDPQPGFDHWESFKGQGVYYGPTLNINGNEIFRVANALNPGTFENDTKTFAIVAASNLSLTTDPVDAVKQMIEFSVSFSEKFHASICDEERAPITKQMISHIESRAQDIARIKQVQTSTKKEVE